MGVAFTYIFNTEIVNNETKNNWAPFVAPEYGSCGRFIVTIFVEAYTEKIICQFASLWQAVALLENFKIDSSIAGVSGEVVFINEFLRYVWHLDGHIPSTINGCF